MPIKMKIMLIIFVASLIIGGISRVVMKNILNENDYPINYFFFGTYSDLRNLHLLTKKKKEIFYKFLFWINIASITLIYLSIILLFVFFY